MYFACHNICLPYCIYIQICPLNFNKTRVFFCSNILHVSLFYIKSKIIVIIKVSYWARRQKKNFFNEFRMSIHEGFSVSCAGVRHFSL